MPSYERFIHYMYNYINETNTNMNIGPAKKAHTFVIQKYIEDPMLIGRRKFDIRVWSMVTHDYKIYFFK